MTDQRPPVWRPKLGTFLIALAGAAFLWVAAIAFVAAFHAGSRIGP